MTDPPPPDLRQWLRNHTGPTAQLTLPREAVAALADALGQARQSADRLRKQNAKLRKRMNRLKEGAGDEAVAEDVQEAADEAPPGESETL